MGHFAIGGVGGVEEGRERRRWKGPVGGRWGGDGGKMIGLAMVASARRAKVAVLGESAWAGRRQNGVVSDGDAVIGR
jgi:hypothetical protein